MKLHKIRPAESGKPERFKVRKNGTVVFVDRCCDCGLAHTNLVKATKRYITFRWWRDPDNSLPLREAKRRLKHLKR